MAKHPLISWVRALRPLVGRDVLAMLRHFFLQNEWQGIYYLPQTSKSETKYPQLLSNGHHAVLIHQVAKGALVQGRGAY